MNASMLLPMLDTFYATQEQSHSHDCIHALLSDLHPHHRFVPSGNVTAPTPHPRQRRCPVRPIPYTTTRPTPVHTTATAVRTAVRTAVQPISQTLVSASSLPHSCNYNVRFPSCRQSTSITCSSFNAGTPKPTPNQLTFAPETN